jgi:hypothetical protein
VDRSDADIRAPTAGGGAAIGAEATGPAAAGANVGGEIVAGASVAGVVLAGPGAAECAALVADADQEGRTELSDRTAGRSCAERAMTDGSWLRRMAGNPPPLAVDGIDACRANPSTRRPAG